MHVPDPIVDRADGTDPEHEALLADSVGLALLVVLETLTPAERLAFVLHDMFAVPFDEIAPIVDRSPDAARQLASRARRRVQGEHAVAGRRPRRASARSSTRSSPPRATATSRRCVAVLDPDVVLRADARRPGADGAARGAEAVVAPGADVLAARPGRAPGARQRRRRAWSRARRRPFSVVAFTVRGGRIVAIDILADPERLRALDLTVLDGWPGTAFARPPPTPAASFSRAAVSARRTRPVAPSAMRSSLGQVLRVAAPEVDPPALERDAPRRVIRLRAQLGEARLGRGLHESQTYCPEGRITRIA